MSSTIQPVSTRIVLDISRQPAKLLSRSYLRSITATSRNAVTQRTEEPEPVPPTVNYSEMSSLAHAELETHREIRSMARLAAWEMPLLSTLSKPFEPPTEAVPLRWRHTTYFGELHPAANKVVVEFGVSDLKHLTEEQRNTLRKLAGPRRDPLTDMVKMSCESFTTQAQNKRYLGDTIANLIKEAVEGKDKFDDIPLDDRHAVKRMKKRTKAFPIARFPSEWYLTPERRAHLDEKRKQYWKEHEIYLNKKLEAAPKEDRQEALELLEQAGIDPNTQVQDGPSDSDLVKVALTAESTDRQMVSGLDIIKLAKQRAVAQVELGRSAGVEKLLSRSASSKRPRR